MLLDKLPLGYISMPDHIREEPTEAIRLLKQDGIKYLLLAGDKKRMAKSVSGKLQMAACLARCRTRNKRVCRNCRQRASLWL